ncbi:precorrin-2 C(20)-methyltransferase [Aureimonas jatrophae]|uniref:Precorrin-2/cobalt-factor-2 C20-methyltransferase n=1 Tax=Aureimonas jatrophae TaxID=1166073 RepID=A0A1H0D8F2_9HYPH|nr:precorrin-2 C(20)-methyltransferase [Aureimonas jatrophae]MBB3951750.1 precorrin-2/cobalt-factor-2 C20-methyltransferase [Aureimonas jatrophae]SDN66256.1 precorrin-2/cobalt-factor-2 C20-methyltransferase [Aureimonas jatrophae]
MTGTLYGLGLGPGDPELLTLKAHRILRSVPVIAYPAAEGSTSLARAIAAPHLPGGQREIAIPILMSGDRAPGRAAYDSAAPVIAEHLAAGRDVAVLCEGDPFFYGSFLYLHARLADRFPTLVVPGVSSVMAAAAASRRPLSARGDVVTVLPATLPDDVLRPAIEAATSLAILKLGRHFSRVKRLLAELGLMDGAIYAERVTQGGERVRPLAETGDEAPYFAMILAYRGTEPAIRGSLA